MFSAVMTEREVLKKGVQYTFTFDSGRIFEYRSKEWVLEQIKYWMQYYGSVNDIDRPLFSDRMIVYIVPVVDVTLGELTGVFLRAFNQMGYGSVKFLFAESGYGSSSPGGIPGITESIVSSVTPVLAIGVGVIILLEIIKSRRK